MLVAKINPPAKFYSQDSPFSDPKVRIADTLRVNAESYKMGADKVRFQAVFGMLVPMGIDTFEFSGMHTQILELEGNDLADWGEDDSVIFGKIAAKIGGFTITEVIDVKIKNDF